MFSVRSLSVVAATVAVSAAASLAAPIAPPAWVQASANPATTAATEFRTYQQWDTFTNVNGPNAPLVGVPGAATYTYNSVLYNASYNANPGTANAYDPTAATDGAFLTSGGNIYSFGSATSTRAIVPLPATDGFLESVTVQVNVAGTGLNTGSFTANGTPISQLGGYNVSAVTAGSGMAGTTAYTINFLLPDAASLQFDFVSAGSSSSLDVLAIDTRSTVPEPASLAVLGVGAAGLLVRRRR